MHEKGRYEAHNLVSKETKVLHASNDPKLFVASLSTSNLNNNESSRIVDFGATHHMMTNKNWFFEYKPHSTEVYVYLINDTHHRIYGNGKFSIKLTNGEINHIPKVLHVLGLTKTLKSIFQATNVGYSFTFTPHSCIMYKINPIKLLQFLNKKAIYTNLALQFLALMMFTLLSKLSKHKKS